MFLKENNFKKEDYEFEHFIYALFQTNDREYNNKELVDKWLQERGGSDYNELVVRCIESDIFVDVIGNFIYDKVSLLGLTESKMSNYDARGINIENYFPYFTDCYSVEEFYESVAQNGNISVSDILNLNNIYIKERKGDIKISDVDYNEYESDFLQNDANDIVDVFMTVREYNDMVDDEETNESYKNMNGILNEILRISGIEKNNLNEYFQNYGILYHGTNSSFDNFNKDYQNGGHLGKGFYFTMSKTMAKSYGKNIRQAKLNYKNSFFFDVDTLSNNIIIEMLDTTQAQNYQKERILNLYNLLVNDNGFYDANSKLFDFVDTFNGDSTLILQKYGYDSIDNMERDSEFVVFNPKQIQIIND